MNPGWQAVIGLEVHVQLATASKIFSGASTTFGNEPNTQACPVDLGFPGVLPVLNREAVRMAATFGLAIGADLATVCRFDRKNYFYPDLPKGYQISQLDEPIVGTGTLTFSMPDGSTRTVGVTRAHLEEDAGKSLHEEFAGQTGVDLNRAGTPLLEIVSEPEMHTPEEAAAYFRALHTLVRYLKICDGNLNEGSMRCDANVSVRRTGVTELGERTEIKNINSFRFVEKAVRFEIDRQIDVLEDGGTIWRETRLYDSERDETRTMRLKELSEDYRYFPDPDLLPVSVDAALIAEAKMYVGELPDAKRARFVAEMALGDDDADQLTADPDIAAFFERAAEVCGSPKLAANWVMGDLAAALNRDQRDISASPVSAENLGTIICRINDNTLSSKTAKSVFDALWSSDVGHDPDAVDTIIDEQGLKQMNDAGELATMVAEVVAANPTQVQQYRDGKTKVLGFFVGQIMKATGGKANPKQLNELLKAELEA